MKKVTKPKPRRSGNIPFDQVVKRLLEAPPKPKRDPRGKG